MFFFEPNGLRHGDFRLRPEEDYGMDGDDGSGGDEKVVGGEGGGDKGWEVEERVTGLRWNDDGTLAVVILCVRRPKGGGGFCCQSHFPKETTMRMKKKKRTRRGRGTAARYSCGIDPTTDGI